jgi:hypothetical protein
VIFIKLSSLSFDPEKPLNINLINDVFCSMQEVIIKFEGMIRQFLVDDKGTGKTIFIFLYF